MFTRRVVLINLGMMALEYVACLGQGVRAQVFPHSAAPQFEPPYASAQGCGIEQMIREPGPRPRLASSGVKELDENMTMERPVLNRFFRVTPDFAFHDDGKTPEALALPSPQGTQILLGLTLVKEEIRLNPKHWQVAIIGILAHEWAHALQYGSLLQEKKYKWETHADYMAGWYLGTKYASGLPTINPAVFAHSLYEKGNKSGYFDPDKYGSPKQRVEAMLAGFDFGRHDFRPNRRPDVWEAANRGYVHVSEREAK